MGNSANIQPTILTAPWLATEIPGNPAVGDDLVHSYTANLLSQIVHVGLQLDTDANVADRYVRLAVRADLQNHELAWTDTAIVANTTSYINFGLNVPTYSIAAVHRYFATIPDNIRLDDASLLYIFIFNKQAGDAITNIRIMWNHWPTTT